MFDKYVALLEEIDSKKALTIEDILKDGFYKHILDRKKAYGEEPGEGYTMYKIIHSHANLIKSNIESCDRGNPKKDHSFVTHDSKELYEYKGFNIYVQIDEARSGNKRYTVEVKNMDEE